MYYQKLCEKLVSSKTPCTIRQCHDNGVGLFATENLCATQVLFRERPFISGQYSWGIFYEYSACHHCLKSLERPLEMVHRLCKDTSIVLPIIDPAPSVDPLSFVHCNGCHVRFCCEECLQRAMSQYHSAVCTKGEVDHPLIKLDELWRNVHFPPETTSLVMIVKIIGLVITDGTIPEIFKHFHKSVESSGHVHKVLDSKFIAQLGLLRDGLLQIYGSNLLVQELLYHQNFVSLIALIGMNGQGIGTSSFADYCRRLENLPISDNEKELLNTKLDLIYDKMDAEVGIFTDVEGTGLYELQSKLNHSCCPNVQIVFASGTDELSVQVTDDVKEGEELHISYLSSCQLESSRHSRRKFILQNYLFSCECSKCRSQITDPDVTSDEEECDEEEHMDS